MINIYIGNLNFATTEEGLKSIFEEYGKVESVKIIVDHFTGRSRGFGFIKMPNDEEARTALTKLDGLDLDGRELRINEARDQR